MGGDDGEIEEVQQVARADAQKLPSLETAEGVEVIRLAESLAVDESLLAELLDCLCAREVVVFHEKACVLGIA